MFGIIRFFLALSVVAFHLTALIPHLGVAAVNAFYLLSGFLMTLVLHEIYGFSFTRFMLNRALRLFPAYIAIATVGLFLSISLSGYNQFHPSWEMGFTFESMIGNAFVFPWAFLSDQIVFVDITGLFFLNSQILHYRIVPSTWSVGVEIICYALLWAFTARNIKIALASFALAAAWHGYVIIAGLDVRLLYYPVIAAMLPFAMGAAAYHLVVFFQIKTLNNAGRYLVVIGTLILQFLIWYMSIKTVVYIGSTYYYLNMLVVFVSVIVINRSRFEGLALKIDKWAGDVAYPMFLFHYICAFAGWHMIGANGPIRGWPVFYAGTALTIYSSIIVVLFIDRPIEALRQRVRIKAVS